MFRTSNKNPRNSVVFVITCYFMACWQFVAEVSRSTLYSKTTNQTIEWNFDIILPSSHWSGQLPALSQAAFGPVFNMNIRDCENC